MLQILVLVQGVENTHTGKEVHTSENHLQTDDYETRTRIPTLILWRGGGGEPNHKVFVSVKPYDAISKGNVIRGIAMYVHCA